MTPYFVSRNMTLYHGNCLQILKTFPAESVHAVVTSPPYWGLRDYRLQPFLWGGNTACDHQWTAGPRIHKGGPHGNGVLLQGGRSVVQAQAAVKDRASGDFCARCNAWLGSLGLEPTVDLFIQHLVLIFREVRRVLRRDGTLWLNLGDSYTSGGRENHGATVSPKQETNTGSVTVKQRRPPQPPELKPKDLVGIPWRTAFALQADGWYLRSDIVWDKRNAMPESVTDRPSKAHDYLFLLAKRKRYFYDHVAVMEPVTGTAHSRGNGVNPKARSLDLDDSSCQSRSPRQNQSFSSSVANLVSLRNKRSVWTVPTQPYPEDHFATFPEELIRTPILAGTSEKGCCGQCGAPYRRILERQRHGDWRPAGDLKPLGINCSSKAKWSQTDPQSSGRRLVENVAAARAAGHEHDHPFPAPITIGWKPFCPCHSQEVAPCVVLDPFIGSGTVGVEGRKAGCHVIGIDASREYLDMAIKRNRQEVLPFLLSKGWG
jgi:DNA modification methylase